MTRIPFVSLLLVSAMLLGNGCLFSKKPHRPKESSAIASDVEESFRKRWVEKRTGELTAQGIAADAARTQAENEFRERFAFNQPGKK